METKLEIVDLRGTPRPHYLTEGSAKQSGNILSFKGKAVFSSSDPTIVDRQHVNVTHEMYAVWNAAHWLVRFGSFPANLRITSQFGSYFREAPIDEEIDLSGEIEILKNDGGRTKGHSTWALSQKGKTLSVLHLTFFATQ